MAECQIRRLHTIWNTLNNWRSNICLYVTRSTATVKGRIDVIHMIKNTLIRKFHNLTRCWLDFPQVALREIHLKMKDQGRIKEITDIQCNELALIPVPIGRFWSIEILPQLSKYACQFAWVTLLGSWICHKAYTNSPFWPPISYSITSKCSHTPKATMANFRKMKIWGALHISRLYIG